MKLVGQFVMSWGGGGGWGGGYVYIWLLEPGETSAKSQAVTWSSVLEIPDMGSNPVACS